LLRVEDVMLTHQQIPQVPPSATLAEALMEITAKGLGMTAVVDQGVLSGIFTDGDLRRALEGRPDIHKVRIDSIMSQGGKTIGQHQLAAEAMRMMEQHQISTLIVTDEDQHVQGVVHLMTLLQKGLA